MDDVLYANNIRLYRSASKRNYSKYKAVQKKIDELNAVPNRWLLGEDYNDALSEYYDQLSTHRAASIVFQEMAIEAFLNDYILLRLGKNLFEAIEKLSPTEKLLIGCKMITGKEFPKGCHAYELLRTVMKERNELVHSKTKVFDIDRSNKILESSNCESQKNEEKNKNTKKGNMRSEQKILEDIQNAYDKIVEQLDSLDDSFDRDYLKEIPDDFWNVEY